MAVRHRVPAILLVALALLAAPPAALAATDVSGVQTGTWTVSGSPYRVVGDVTVPSGQALTIEPGVEVAVTDTFRITVQGALLAEGTADAPILFHAATPGGRWRGLRLVDADPACRLVHCTISDGEVVGDDWPEDTGGGLRLWHTPALVRACIFRDNTASYLGGGAFCYGDSAVFEDCLFTGNHSNFDGGALYIHTSDAAVTNCSFLGNTCTYYGAAMAQTTSYSTVRRCLFAGNAAGGQAGAVRMEWSGPAFVNCTFTDNTAPYGGGLYVVTTTVDLVNCIDKGNSGYAPEIYLDWLGEARVAYSDIHGDGTAGPGNLDVDPGFADPAAGDYRLGDGSPCIDAGAALYVNAAGDTLVNLAPGQYNGAAPDMGYHEHVSLTGVPGGTIPSRPRLLANRPNPFNPATTVAFDLPAGGPARLEVLDLRGRRVRLLLEESLPAGRHAVTWRGRDDTGRAVPSGVYLLRLTAGGVAQARAVELVR